MRDLINDEIYECQKCGNQVLDYQPQLCCDGRECGCLGLPLEPCICTECWDNYYINLLKIKIKEDVNERFNKIFTYAQGRS